MTKFKDFLSNIDIETFPILLVFKTAVDMDKLSDEELKEKLEKKKKPPQADTFNFDF